MTSTNVLDTTDPRTDEATDRDRFGDEVPTDLAVRAATIAAAVTSLVLLVALVALPLDTTASSPLHAYAAVVALSSAPFAAAVATFALARLRSRRA